MCSEDPRIPARSILELSRMLHSHRPLPRGPLCVPYLSSFPPPVFLPYSSLSLLLVNTPLPRPIRISTLAKRSVVSFKCYTLRGISSPSFVPFLSFLFLPFSFPSRSFLHIFYFFILFPFLCTLSLLLLPLVPYRKATREPSVRLRHLRSRQPPCAPRDFRTGCEIKDPSRALE